MDLICWGFVGAVLLLFVGIVAWALASQPAIEDDETAFGRAIVASEDGRFHR